MDVRGGSGVNRIACRPVRTLLYVAAVLGIFLSTVSPASALPAFARKYGMPCSSCHEAWPKLSPFGQQFKDNGYQMGNDRDAPIFQSPAYWPVTFRITPQWHRESTNKAQVDGSNGPGGNEAQVTTHGFDWSGLDFHTGGTLAKDVSFYVLPSSDNTGAFHFESVWARLDNIGGSSWLNIKMGKFELDNLLSEKRILTLTSISGVYTNYHFQPMYQPGVSQNPNFVFGIGDNQVGVEWLGHSKDDRTRISASLLSSNDGSPGLPTSRGYDGFFAASRAFQLGSLGLQRVGGFAYIGEAPTYFQYNLTTTTPIGTTTAGDTVNSTATTPYAGTGIGNKGFQRYGLIGMWYIKKFDITTIYFHGTNSAWLASNTAAVPGATLPVGAHSPSWNGGLFESHYNLNPQLILINRYELVRMSQQAFTGDGVTPANPSNLGNTDVLTFGLRYYPFISSRAGFAYHAEYAIIRQRGASPVTFSDLTSSSLLFGFDFDF
jgi:hypothetical protein